MLHYLKDYLAVNIPSCRYGLFDLDAACNHVACRFHQNFPRQQCDDSPNNRYVFRSGKAKMQYLLTCKVSRMVRYLKWIDLASDSLLTIFPPVHLCFIFHDLLTFLCKLSAYTFRSMTICSFYNGRIETTEAMTYFKYSQNTLFLLYCECDTIWPKLAFLCWLLDMFLSFQNYNS